MMAAPPFATALMLVAISHLLILSSAVRGIGDSFNSARSLGSVSELAQLAVAGHLRAAATEDEGAPASLLAGLPRRLQGGSNSTSSNSTSSQQQAKKKKQQAKKKKQQPGNKKGGTKKKGSHKPAPKPPPRPAPKPAPKPAPTVLHGMDVSGSSAPYGSCTAVADWAKSGHWCNVGVAGQPASPDLKYGRQTIYGNGGGKGWCGETLGMDSSVADVAVSTKYITPRDVSPNCKYCGACMCIRVRGCDTNVNQFPPPSAEPYYGKVFKGRAKDQCPECTDDSIDVLGGEAYFAAVPQDIVYTVGVWTAEWQWVDCDTDCNSFFGSR